MDHALLVDRGMPKSLCFVALRRHPGVYHFAHRG
jgi:hypothetical protein